MKCPKCTHNDTKVLESRLTQDGYTVRRRRSCRHCDYRYTTYEKEEDFVFHIRKTTGQIEPYHRSKALRSIQIACQKRPVKLEELEFMLSQVERAIIDKGERTIESKDLGNLIMQKLYELDKVGYIRFASVYKDFKDPQEFLKTLAAIEKDSSKKDK